MNRGDQVSIRSEVGKRTDDVRNEFHFIIFISSFLFQSEERNGNAEKKNLNRFKMWGRFKIYQRFLTEKVQKIL